jgi:Zn-dependent M28 family amino/carboxypeptidase
MLIGSALEGEGSYEIARGLADGVGHRLAGSAGAERAVAWALAELRRAGLSNVRAEKVKVPRWERGPRAQEWGKIVAPVEQELALTALGGSVGTGAAGVSGEVIEVRSFAELSGLPAAQVAGKIVLFNVAMERRQDGMGSYADVAAYRGKGAIAAAEKGAAAALVRSLGVASYRLPHTGAMRYAEKVKKIPAAAVSAEDADLLHRLLERGPVRVRVGLGCRNLPEGESANVIGEVRGRERPEEIVLLSAHLDSWDVGTGAVDDAAGVAMVIGAARAMVRAGLVPRRTVRVVLFANEESGLGGAKGYAQAHRAEIGRHVAALEADSGGGRPLGFRVRGAEAARALRGIVAPLAGIGAGQVTVGDAGGADLLPIDKEVPIFHLAQDTSRYFEWHHTMADTLDKIDPVELGLGTAAIAVAAYGVADQEERLPLQQPEARP